MAFPNSPSVGTTYQNARGTTYVFNAKGAWDIQSIGQGYLPSSSSAGLALAPATLPAMIVGVAFSQAFTASGGTAPYTYAVTAGVLPAGLSLTTGTLSGTPTTAGPYSFTITATDSAGTPKTVSKAYSGNVAATGISITPTTMGALNQGTAYSQTFSAAGGTSPYTWAVSSGALPAGLSLNASTGVISGTPTAQGDYSFTLSATDSAGTPKTGSQAYAGTVGAPIVLISPTALPGMTRGEAISIGLTASGGTSPYAWNVQVGSLPAGLSLNSSTGVISGTPSTAGTTNFTIRAVDAAARVATQAYSAVVSEPVTSSFYWGAGEPSNNAYQNGDVYYSNDLYRLYRKISGTWAIRGTFENGAPDLSHVAGTASLLSGSGAPVDSQGMNGDYYLDTATNRLYGPKYLRSWNSSAQLVLDPSLPSGITSLLAIGASEQPTSQCKYWIQSTTRRIFQYAFGSNWYVITDRVPSGGQPSFNRDAPVARMLDYAGTTSPSGSQPVLDNIVFGGDRASRVSAYMVWLKPNPPVFHSWSATSGWSAVSTI